MGLGSPLNASNDIGHGARAVGAENLDGIDLGLLGDTILLASNGARAVGAVPVTIDIGIARGDGLAPVGTALKVNMVDVGASIDDIGINTLAALGSKEVLVEGGEAQRIPVRDTGQPPGGTLLSLAIAFVLGGNTHGVDDAITLDVLDLRER